MAAIPLYKYLAEQYPETPKSTKHFWVKQALLNGAGPLAGLTIFRIGRPYYIQIPDENVLVNNIVHDIVARAREKV